MGRGRIPALLLALFLTGCYTGEGSGRVVVERFDVDGFSAVVLSGDGKVIIVPGEHAVSVSAEDDVLPAIDVTVRGRTLYLQREVDWIDGVRPTVPIEFRVSVPTLASVEVSGSGIAAIREAQFEPEVSFSTSGAGSIDAASVSCRRLNLRVGGSGDVTVTGLVADSFEGVVGGTGRVTAAGAAHEVDVEVSGSGLFRGGDLRGSTASVRVRGVGQAFVWADQRLDVDVGGDGRVVYRGEPAVDKRLRQDHQLVAMQTREAADGD